MLNLPTNQQLNSRQKDDFFNQMIPLWQNYSVLYIFLAESHIYLWDTNKYNNVVICDLNIVREKQHTIKNSQIMFLKTFCYFFYGC